MTTLTDAQNFALAQRQGQGPSGYQWYVLGAREETLIPAYIQGLPLGFRLRAFIIELVRVSPQGQSDKDWAVVLWYPYLSQFQIIQEQATRSSLDVDTLYALEHHQEHHHL